MIRVFAMIRTLFLTAVVCGAFVLAATPTSQSEPLTVKFEVDGKELDLPIKILFSVGGSMDFEPTISNGSFAFPPELIGYEKVRLRVIAGKYDLDFGEVHLSKFSGEMIFGVDKKPFDEANLVGEPPPGKELVGINYIRFEPKEGAATMLIVSEYR